MLPETSGITGQALITTDGTGTLEWATVAGSGTVTSIDATGSNGISVTGGPVTTNGTFDISLDNTGVTGGNYRGASFVVDNQGRITSATNNGTFLGDLGNVDLSTDAPVSGQVLSWNGSAWVPLSVSGTGSVTSVDATGFGGIDITGGPITAAGSFNVTLGDTAVTPGTYTYGTFTVDQQGRITNASSGVTPLIDPLTTNGDMMFRFETRPACRSEAKVRLLP